MAFENKGNNPLTNNHFLIRVDAVFDLPCFKISSFKYEKEFENIQSGGINDYIYLREKQNSTRNTFTIERYVDSKFYDPLPVGNQPALPIILYVSRHPNDFSDAKETFYFTGCTVISKSYGELDAQRSGLITQSTTIAYQKVYADVQNDDPTSDWSFDVEGKDYKGTGKRHAIVNTLETRKVDNEKQKRLWPDKSSGRGYETPGSAETKQRLWPTTRSARTVSVLGLNDT